MDQLNPVPFEVDLGFVRDEKALSSDEAAAFDQHLDDGDVLISGWAANFEVDREHEAFADVDALQNDLKSFVEGDAALCYHHRHGDVIGKVLAADLIPGKGVRVVARVDKQPESSPLRHIYEQVKKGTLNALSFGGFFKRAMLPAGPRIVGADFTELSITGVPVGRGTNFAVVATKALEDIKLPEVPAVDGEIREEDKEAILWNIESLNSIFARISKRSQPASGTDA